MLKEFYTAALGMVNQQTRLEVAANNMANASTPGFRREEIFVRNLIDARANFYNVKGDAEQNDPPIGSYHDFEEGGMQQTNNPLDIALNNKNDFFVLQDDEGKRYLSKAGRFKLDGSGYIRAMDGKFLMADTGKISISGQRFVENTNDNPTTAIDVKINDNGEIIANDIIMGNLLIARPDDPQTLQRVAGADFIPTNLTVMNFVNSGNESNDILVKQGFLENSNVDIVREMVEMIELQKNFEAGQKVITTNDGTLDRAINLGRYFG
jgi:flagellar basal body rod protein FlgG